MNRLDLVGHQRLSDGSDDRNSPSHGGLKGDRPADGAGAIKQLRTMLREHCLIRRDHVLAALQHFEHDRPVGLQPADKLHNGLDFRIVEYCGNVGAQQARRRADIAGTPDVRVDDPHQLHFASDLARNTFRMLQQYPCHARSDGAKADQGNFCGRVRHRLIIPSWK